MDTKIANLMIIAGVIIVLLIPSAFFIDFTMGSKTLVANPVSNNNNIFSESELRSMVEEPDNSFETTVSSSDDEEQVQEFETQNSQLETVDEPESYTFTTHSSSGSSSARNYLGGSRDKVTQSVKDKLANEGEARVIVNFDSASEKSAVKTILNNKGLDSHSEWNNGLSVTADEDTINDIKAETGVNLIEEDLPLRPANAQSFPQINVDKAINVNYNNYANLTGAGQTVCIIDTGVEYNHDDLGNCTGTQFFNNNCPKTIGGYDFCGDSANCAGSPDADPGDQNGHGTSIAGIIAGKGAGYTGIAPDAKIVALKVTDANGIGWNSLLRNAVQWCVDNATKYNISIISIGLAFDSPTFVYNTTNSPTYCDTGTTNTAIASAVAAGISVFAPTGNHEDITEISFPACNANVTSISAVADGSGSTATDLIPNKSVDIWGPDRFPGMTDLMAPGSDIYVLDLESGSKYGTGAGTSFSMAHAVGSAILLKEYNQNRYSQNLTPAQITNILKITGKSIYDVNTSASYPRIDILKAIRYETNAPIVSQETANSINFQPGSITLNYNVTDEFEITNCSLYLNNTLNQTDSTITSGTTQSFSLTLPAGSYSWKVSCNDNSTFSNNGNSTSRTFTVGDTIPPATVTSLSSSAKGQTWIMWTWTNPGDADFNEAIIYIGSTNVANITGNSYNATGLSPNTSYTIKIHTKDNVGNINTTNVSDTNTTLLTPDTTAPATITGLTSTSQGQTWIMWTWTNPTDGDFSQCIVFVNGSNVANTSNNYYNATGLSPNSSYTINIHTEDTNSNINSTDVTDTNKTLPTPDTTAPATITGLSSSGKGQDWIEWTWTNPADSDFNEAIVYIGSTNVANITGNTYNATGLTANTAYTIKIHTKDNVGNVNNTDVTDTVTTLAIPDTTAPGTISGLTSTKDQTWIEWSWTNPGDSDFDEAIIFIDSVNVANITGNSYNATGLSPNTSHTIIVHTKDTNNNVNSTDVTDTVTTLATPPAPDLTITSLQLYRPVSPTSTSLVVYHFIIENLGNQIANNVNWELDMTVLQKTSQRAFNISPGERVKVSSGGVFNTSGNINVTATVDYADTVTELNEGNNILSLIQTVS